MVTPVLASAHQMLSTMVVMAAAITCFINDKDYKFGICSLPGLDLLFSGSQGEYDCMWRCPRPGLNPSGLVNNSSLAAGPQFTEVKIL